MTEQAMNLRTSLQRGNLDGRGTRDESLTGRAARLWVALALILGAARLGAAETLPIEPRSTATQYNVSSGTGVPISTTAGTPPGSDGRAPTGINESGTYTVPTDGQFRSIVFSGGGAAPFDWTKKSTHPSLSGTTPFSSDVATTMQLPVVNDGGTNVLVLRNLRMGSPYAARASSVYFGGVLSVPAIDESGKVLEVLKEEYWLPEPYTTNSHANAGYYWSPHARVVYANQAGPVRVTWRKASPYTTATLPLNYANAAGSVSFQTNGSSIFLLYTATYTVSGSPVKPPRTIYWTEREFRTLGLPISIPPSRIGAVNIVYNTGFPRTVADEYRGPGYTTPTDGSTSETLKELRTLWYDQAQGFMQAFNHEGRVFVELLGDLRSDGVTRNPIGFEIVDVIKQPAPLDVDCDLGERIIPPQGAPVASLTPREILQGTTPSFVYQYFEPGDSIPRVYAARATAGLNDCLVHWMEKGVADVLWPKYLGRHRLVWPTDVARYSHYIRPQVETEAEAMETAVVVSPRNVPMISDQDVLDRPRAKLTADSKFYTFLDESQPFHRTLLRYTVAGHVGFERVFSWLDSALRDGAFSGTLATNLTEVGNYVAYPDRYQAYTNAVALAEELYQSQLLAYQRYVSASNQYTADLTAYVAYLANPGSYPTPVARPTPPTWVAEPVRQEVPPLPENQLWATVGVAPRIVTGTARVGERILPPAGEPGSSGAYLAGHINPSQGTLYHPTAYIDPLAAGNAAAAAGAIIPVNAVPGQNLLEVWWFRPNKTTAGFNAGNTKLGFVAVQWPAYIGRYTIAWPENPPEIVLASRLGSGTLDSRQAKGAIYGQSQRNLAGYNPNEEHAIMSGGMAFATRDDLNITSGPEYSSEPYVLLDYVALDGRPAMEVFKVLREKPEAGFVFDYIVPAGQMIQPPPPLTFLPRPVEGTGMYAVNYNVEVRHGTGDLPGGWDPDGENGAFGHYDAFTWKDRKNNLWVYRAAHAGIPALEAGTYDTDAGTFGALSSAVAVAGEEFVYVVHASRQDENLTMVAPSDLPSWLRLDGLRLIGKPDASHAGQVTIPLRVVDLYDGATVNRTLSLDVLASGTAVAQGPLTLASENPYTGTTVEFTDRPPYLAASPSPENSFTLRFYYKTQDGFDWPGVTNPPATGSIVPYLRPLDSQGKPVGEPGSKDTESLEIVYRPVWPVRDPKDSSKPLPTLPYGATLAMPAFNLPGIRDMRTARVVYQQSIAADITDPSVSVVLHDATRAKFSSLADHKLSSGVPTSVRTEMNRGLVYFPALPPHLAKRVYVDPNRGLKGTLVLKGEFNRAAFGLDYTMLNVLRGSDLQAVRDLCPMSDSVNKSNWDALVNDLATDLETFVENPDTPGTYIPDEDATVTVGVQDLAVVESDETAVDSYALTATGPGSGYVTVMEANGFTVTQDGDPVSMHVFKAGRDLYVGEVKVIPAENPLSELVTLQHTGDMAGRFDEFEYEWKIGAPVDGAPPVVDATMSRYQSLVSGTDLPRHTIGGAGIQALTDNYVVMRYRPKNPGHPLHDQWSDWTSPKLAEGWIKRVLAGINPFGQRLTDLFNNAINTDVSLLTQAGRRWEGDVALNMDTINNYGLIEIYETVLRRGRMLSIEAGFNYGPANDALLLAAGYLHDLYFALGNEAWADAANPTIGIGTKDARYGDVATALFAFKGQVANLADEELALLRGRDDFLVPGVRTPPVYNRLVWNYTRGISAGEVVYALNYNIKEDASKNPDGIINAQDASLMYPQGHGDAYGHYLTSIKGYYSLLMNSRFDWMPRIEAVNVLGQPVAVDYQDERKFAAGAVSLARAGQQVVDLTWRKSYGPKVDAWEQFGATRTNAQATYTTPEGTRRVTRHWGLDHWATRTGQGSYVHWVVGNAVLPPVDPDPEHEGIQRVDRTTVPELQELASIGAAIQTSVDGAEGGNSPMGIPEGGVAFDLDPTVIVGSQNGTHFEQIYQRAKVALNNAVASFDDAKDVTQLMRSEEDSLDELRASVVKQETAYKNALIELYGTPYPDDIGPGKTWPQGYSGPDLVHYPYVDTVESTFSGRLELDPPLEIKISIQRNFVLGTEGDLEPSEVEPEDWVAQVIGDNWRPYSENVWYKTNQLMDFTVDAHGFFVKPESWTGRRASPGKLQQAISDVIAAHGRLASSIRDAEGSRQELAIAATQFKALMALMHKQHATALEITVQDEVLADAKAVNDLVSDYQELVKEALEDSKESTKEGVPDSVIAGVASGGDVLAPAKAAVTTGANAAKAAIDGIEMARKVVEKALETAIETQKRWIEFDAANVERILELKGAMTDISLAIDGLDDHFFAINARLREHDNAQRAYRALMAQGDRIQEERMVFRQRAAQVIQGYRTRDTAFRIFRNEKLERYKTMFDLAARYALLAANAYDYETGLLGTTQGRNFKKRIIESRALGVVRNGEPQFAGSNTGDPGLSSALAEMKADWDVLRGRLGFNNPDAYGTTVSLRTEAFRILPTADGDSNWKDTLHAGRVANLLEDEDIRRHCMQIDDGSGLPVPGIVLSFGTTIANGLNLFGRELSALDQAFNSSAFATKIFGVGVALTGYRGMVNPMANSGSTGGVGTSPEDPSSAFLDPLALAGAPYVYLIPVGVDSMRSPPLGDASKIRSWSVEDVAIPMPFNIGGSDFSSRNIWQTGEALTEPLFTVRKHQAFRPVSTTSVFSPNLYGGSGSLLRSQFTNNRLVGRSVWNSQWKLVIPGRTLLNNPNEGLDRLIQTLTDVKLHFVTYSYSGN